MKIKVKGVLSLVGALEATPSETTVQLVFEVVQNAVHNPVFSVELGREQVPEFVRHVSRRREDRDPEGARVFEHRSFREKIEPVQLEGHVVESMNGPGKKLDRRLDLGRRVPREA